MIPFLDRLHNLTSIITMQYYIHPPSHTRTHTQHDTHGYY